MRSISRPVRFASLHQRCRSFSSPASSGASFFRRLPSSARNHAHLDHYDERAILIPGGEGPAHIVRLQHGALHRIVRSAESATPSPLAPWRLYAALDVSFETTTVCVVNRETAIVGLEELVDGDPGRLEEPSHHSAPAIAVRLRSSGPDAKDRNGK